MYPVFERLDIAPLTRLRAPPLRRTRFVLEKLSEMGIELVVISLGKQGAIACYQGTIYDVVAPDVKPISTIGSGDSMIAGLICGLDGGKTIVDSLKLGCAAGAATAMSDGADIGEKSDIDELISSVKITRIEPA